MDATFWASLVEKLLDWNGKKFIRLGLAGAFSFLAMAAFQYYSCKEGGACLVSWLDNGNRYLLYFFGATGMAIYGAVDLAAVSIFSLLFRPSSDRVLKKKLKSLSNTQKEALKCYLDHDTDMLNLEVDGAVSEADTAILSNKKLVRYIANSGGGHAIDATLLEIIMKNPELVGKVED